MPVPTPTNRETIVPPISTTNTFTPTSAPTNTKTYGNTFNKLYSKSPDTAYSPFIVSTKKIIIVIIAAGKTIRKFSLNLSFISHPCVLTAAIVVSEIIDKLSPNIAPQTTAPIQTAIGKPVFSLIPTAIGARAAIVPMEVPMETEIKQPITNKPTTAKLEGKMERPKLTVLSTPPAAVTAPENPPAHKKIKLIVMILSSPTPFAITEIFSSKESPLFCTNATHNATKNATIAGIA